MRTLLLTAAVLLLAGCSGQPKATATASSRSDVPSTTGGAPNRTVVAAAPNKIEELTAQTMVYECPKCGTDFDAAGSCTMDGSTLVATRVDYSCPADGKAVEKAGQCPRCAMHARVEKTTLASAAAPSDAAPGGH